MTTKKAPVAATDEGPTQLAYKGFTLNDDGTMQCRNYPFVEGETYEEQHAVLCRSGFHACQYPLDVFGYYPPAGSVFHEVLVDESAKPKPGDDTKVASKRIKIGARLTIAGIVKAAVEYTIERSTPEPGGRATGDRGAASATGDRGAASATGDQGAASATGYQGAASATGQDSSALAAGYLGQARGIKGAALFLAERDDDYHIIAVAAVIVGRKHAGRIVKADTWYSLRGGKLVEVDAWGDPK